MKERYRTVTVCLSLLILALVFAVASDEELSRICIPLAFFAGTLLYGTGAAYDRKAGKKMSLTAWYIRPKLIVTDM